MSDSVIRVENLGKRYLIGHQQQRGTVTLRDEIAAATKSWFGLLKNPTSTFQSQTEEFWALKDVSFEVKQGEVVGIIGRNGAGKSTLLKILSRITDPTEGKVFIKGRVASLLEVGTGFHPELTGRENIFLNGSILGMSRIEIKSRFDEIVDFSEIERFLDTPVKFYSSGMYVRLAFAVAAHLDPEILIVDEALAVGDVSFQKKCMGKMQDAARKEGKSILFVSHNMKAVETLCKQAIILNKGKIEGIGDASFIIKNYLSVNTETLYRLDKTWESDNLPGNNLIKIHSIKAVPNTSNDNLEQTDITYTSPMMIQVVYEILCSETTFILALHLKTLLGDIVFATASKLTTLKAGVYITTCLIPCKLLNSCTYLISLYFDRGYGKHLFVMEDNPELRFKVYEDVPRDIGIPVYDDYPGAVRPDLNWETKLLTAII
jgi:lipopolysaccharide transport system ATP-binding protein